MDRLIFQNFRTDFSPGRAQEKTPPKLGENQEPAFSLGWEAPVRQANTFDEARKAAESFIGKPITNTDDGTVATVSSNSLRKTLHSKASSKSASAEVHALLPPISTRFLKGRYAPTPTRIPIKKT